jgi:N-carbamoyl-L-amino-acid hydrolase
MSTFSGLWAELEPIGREATTGGYRRYAFNSSEMACREWFISTAQQRGLDVELDRNTNLWAWWIPPSADPAAKALVIGSHLDSVPDGGAFDGPLGVVSAFAAFDQLRASGIQTDRPVAIVAFADEEGARFGIACAGSRLLTGALEPDKARSLVGRDGATMAEAMNANGFDAMSLGADHDRLARIGQFVELHVEQGKGLVDLDQPVGVAECIWPHGRYRFTFNGRADHAGTTRMQDRQDPMIAYAHTALRAFEFAQLSAQRATFGRLEVEPNGTNAVPSTVRAWLDARAVDESTLDELVSRIRDAASAAAADSGTSVEMTAESVTGVLDFDASLRAAVATAISSELSIDDIPVLPTAAGHDAGILASAGVPTAMIFVRNPTGVSHSPLEHADEADCEIGVTALAAAVTGLLT